MIKQDILENQVNSIYLGIGSNLGRKKNNIEKAKFELTQRNIKVSQSSNFYESLSWPNPNNPKFLNVVLRVSTNLSPLELMKKCKEIEIFLGRKKRSKNSPRECDIDIIEYNQKVSNKEIILPHPREHLRKFVMQPLYEIEKNWIHPILKSSVAEILEQLDQQELELLSEFK